MIEILVTGGVGLLTSIISSIITWLLAKKKYNAEVDTNIIDNMKSSLEFYKSLADDQAARLENQKVVHESEIRELKDQLTELKQRFLTLESENAELRKQILNLSMNVCMNLSCTQRESLDKKEKKDTKKKS